MEREAGLSVLLDMLTPPLPRFPSNPQAAVVHETGPASALKIEKAWPVPAITDGQVLVSCCHLFRKRVFARNVFLCRRHAYSVTSHNCDAAVRRSRTSLPESTSSTPTTAAASTNGTSPSLADRKAVARSLPSLPRCFRPQTLLA